MLKFQRTKYHEEHPGSLLSQSLVQNAYCFTKLLHHYVISIAHLQHNCFTKTRSEIALRDLSSCNKSSRAAWLSGQSSGVTEMLPKASTSSDCLWSISCAALCSGLCVELPHTLSCLKRAGQPRGHPDCLLNNKQSMVWSKQSLLWPVFSSDPGELAHHTRGQYPVIDSLSIYI